MVLSSRSLLLAFEIKNSIALLLPLLMSLLIDVCTDGQASNEKIRSNDRKAGNSETGQASRSKTRSFNGNFGRKELAETSDFFELVTNDVYIDKSLLIDDYLNDQRDLLRILRPNGWGKTTNLSMLKRFFDIEIDENGQRLSKGNRRNRKLFTGGNISLTADTGSGTKHLKPLAIARYKEHMKRQGKYPVLYVSFETAVGTGCAQVERQLKSIVSNLFRSTSFVRVNLDKSEERDFEAYCRGNITGSELEESLQFLSRLVAEYFQQNVYIFLDDYDTPLVSVFANAVNRILRNGERTEQALRLAGESPEFRATVRLVRDLLSMSFAHNGALEHGLISGVYDIRFERDPNDPLTRDFDREPYTQLNTERYWTHYGFSEKEVWQAMMKKVPFVPDPDQVRQWYGYEIAGRLRYNPASVRRFLANEDRQYRHYWRDNRHADNTSLAEAVLRTDDMQLIAQSLVSGKRFRSRCHSTVHLDERLIGNLNVLLYGGYLNGRADGDAQEDLAAANVQIRDWLLRKIHDWTYERSNGTAALSAFDKIAVHLARFQTVCFQRTLKRLLESVPNDGDRKMKLYYNGIVLFVIISLERRYAIEDSSRSDYSRGNVMAIFRSADRTKLIILKYKIIEKTELPSDEIGVSLKVIKNLLDVHKRQHYADVRKVFIIVLIANVRTYRLQCEIVTK